MHKAVAVDRPVDQLKVPNSRLGTVDRYLGSVDRPVDRQTGSDCFGKFAELEFSPNWKLIPRVFFGYMREAKLSSLCNVVILVLIHQSIEISLPCPEDVGEISRTSLNLVLCSSH